MVYDYYVILIIITIIGFLLTITLGLYFVYLPALRAAAKFDDIVIRGTEILETGREVAQDVNQTASTLSDFFVALCTGINNNNGELLRIINEDGSFTDTCNFILSCTTT